MDKVLYVEGENFIMNKTKNSYCKIKKEKTRNNSLLELRYRQNIFTTCYGNEKKLLST